MNKERKKEKKKERKKERSFHDVITLMMIECTGACKALLFVDMSIISVLKVKKKKKKLAGEYVGVICGEYRYLSTRAFCKGNINPWK